MKNGKLRRLGGLLALLLVLTCLLSMSAFADNDERYGYTKLDSEQKKMYEEVHDIVEAKTVYEIIIESDGSVEDWSPAYNLSEKCTVSYDDAVEVLRMFTADYPEYYWFDGTAGLATYGDGTVAYLYNFEYTHTSDDDAEKFEAATAALLADCPNGSDYEKALYIHDALANRIIYDLGWQDEQSAYSALVDGRAVCAGYARSYQYLLNRVGIDAWTVEGFGWNPQDGSLESHAWNLVWIDNKCVYTDVTWDDQNDPGRIGRILYAYFNRSLEDISEDHVTGAAEEPEWVDYYADKLPRTCGHDEETYFAKNGVHEVPEISIETLATNVRGTGEDYVINVLYKDLDKDVFTEWFLGNENANMYALINAVGARSYGVSGVRYTCMGDELSITIELNSYGEPMPYLVGYIGEVTAKGKLTAYVNYAVTDLDASETYETVMVAYYSEDHALQSVDFTRLKLDAACCGELESDCPDEFAYCRVFVVGSDENPEPLCDLLQMSMPK